MRFRVIIEFFDRYTVCLWLGWISGPNLRDTKAPTTALFAELWGVSRGQITKGLKSYVKEVKLDSMSSGKPQKSFK